MYAAAFLTYATTRAFTWDESYHLLAAQLIGAGKTPYLDFCFPQTPLNAYWNAAWMRLLGQSWRVPHILAALLTVGAVLMTADFARRRFSESAAITAGAVTGLNAMVFIYGPLAQPYGMCLFTLVLSFRIAVRAVDREGPLATAAAGFFAGAAAASSLLSAVAAPVLLVWTLVYNRAGSRRTKLVAFVIGASIPFAPVVWLFSRGPRQTWFSVIEYHLFFRKLYWPETTSHDIEVLTSWIESPQALLTGLLAGLGVLYVSRRSQWPEAVKAEYYLCAWLAVALCVEVSLAHPTFERYFLLPVPFLAILAVAGLYAIQSKRAALVVSAIFVLGLGRSLYDRRESDTWSDYERLAQFVDRVTPRDALLLADEPIYFLTRRAPPPGFELAYTHKIDLPAEDRALLHILTEDEVKRQAHSGKFATAYSCSDHDIDAYDLGNSYRRRMDMDDCAIFWDPIGEVRAELFRRQSPSIIDAVHKGHAVGHEQEGIDAVRAALDEGGGVNELDKTGWTPLMHAALECRGGS